MLSVHLAGRLAKSYFFVRYHRHTIMRLSRGCGLPHNRITTRTREDDERLRSKAIIIFGFYSTMGTRQNGGRTWTSSSPIISIIQCGTIRSFYQVARHSISAVSIEEHNPNSHFQALMNFLRIKVVYFAIFYSHLRRQFS